MGALKYGYAVIVIAETAYLLWRYLTDPPASNSLFSVTIGWIGLISMVVMLVYSIARRSRSLRRFARLSYWLHFHIFCGVQGFVLVLFHCWHLFFGREAAIQWLNPGVINLIAVAIVFFSGIFGRYLYSKLPHALREQEEAPSALLQGAEKVFRRWIILHRPLATIMYVLSVVHVILSYMFTPVLGQ